MHICIILLSIKELLPYSKKLITWYFLEKNSVKKFVFELLPSHEWLTHTFILSVYHTYFFILLSAKVLLLFFLKNIMTTWHFMKFSFCVKIFIILWMTTEWSRFFFSFDNKYWCCCTGMNETHNKYLYKYKWSWNDGIAGFKFKKKKRFWLILQIYVRTCVLKTVH